MSKNYVPVLCCSSDKEDDKGRFRYNDQPVKFVASPKMVSQNGVVFHKPDDKIPGENDAPRPEG
jgi:hypothetical protein